MVAISVVIDGVVHIVRAESMAKAKVKASKMAAANR
jgi:hypothetical protein